MPIEQAIKKSVKTKAAIKFSPAPAEIGLNVQQENAGRRASRPLRSTLSYDLFELSLIKCGNFKNNVRHFSIFKIDVNRSFIKDL